jgi:pilus assembly protein CpaC
MLSSLLSTCGPVLRGCAMILFVALFFAMPYAHAAGDQTVKLTLGKADIVPIGGAVSDIMVADPRIADVSALQSDKLYIVGAKIGSTNVMALDSAGEVIKRINVVVSVDTAGIKNMVRELFPNERDVNVHMIGDHLALTGVVSTPTAAQKISRVVAAHMGRVQGGGGKPDDIIENLLEVRGEQQVMLRVRIVELSRDVLKELGIETNANNPSTATQIFGRNSPSSLNRYTGSIGTANQTGLTEDPFGVASLLYNSGIPGLGQIEVLLNALERDNLANVLAEPNLTAISGEQAGFLAGGEFPVPTGRDQDGNIIIEYKEFGVSLNFKPIVLSEDRISLQLNTEVSSLDPGQGITLQNLQIPGLDVRRASTTVEINSGGSLMMAGLLRSENIKGLSGLPGIKDTPVIGDLVSSKSFQRQETELVVVVTPYLVQPFADPNQANVIENAAVNDTVLPPMPPIPGEKGLMKEKVESAPISQAEPPRPLRDRNSPLSKVFSNNMKRVYGDRVSAVPGTDKSYGYLID